MTEYLPIAPRAFVSEFVIKVASRCNLNCKYCYMYNLADTTWQSQPKFISDEVYEHLLERIVAHARVHNLNSISLVLHGGEPLLCGADRIDWFFSQAERVLCSNRIKLTLGAQSNGLLLSKDIGEVFKKHNARVGISLDGLPGKGDSNRVDRQGRPSGHRLEKVLNDFLEEGYREQFGGFLTVVDPLQDPIELFRYLAAFQPESIDFRFPLTHHSHGATANNGSSGSFSRFYRAIFTELLKSKQKIQIRFLDAIVRGLVQNKDAGRVLGNQELGVAVIETNGEYELVDNLKALGNGLTKSSLNVFRNSLDEFVAFRDKWIERSKVFNLPDVCSTCNLRKICQGGFYIHRYSQSAGFNNPSIFCSDLKALIPYMHQQLS